MTMSSIKERVGVRQSLRRQRGQALPLGALGLLIMALAIIATMNLGQAVHEKIKLQNSADAAAYSLAAMEARAFNFIALTNRVQIVHYNSAMAYQSYLSYAGYCMGMFGTVRDLLEDLSMALQAGCQYPYPVNLPYCALTAYFTLIAKIAAIIYKIVEIAYKVLHETAPLVVDALGAFNKASIWQMQFIRALQINAHLITGMQDFVKANDPTMTYSAKNQLYNIVLNGALNSLEFRSAFDRAAGLNPFWLDSLVLGYSDIQSYADQETDQNKTAHSIMTEISNASRSHENIFDRSMGGFALTSYLVATVGGSKHGQTKLISKDKTPEPEPGVEEMHEGKSNYLQGDTLASDDYLQAGFGMATAGIAWVLLFPNGIAKLGDGIVADTDGGKHYKYDHSSGGAAPGGQSSVLILPPPQGSIADSVTKDGDSDHDWQGMSPYFKFSPSSDKNSDFNQPSTWIFLNKHHSAFQSGSGSGGRPWHYKFTWDNGGSHNDGKDKDGAGVGGGKYEGAVSLDTTIGGERSHFLLEGLNAISRGMVYYHRPGVWDEPPNFFNPFWRARLAPVGAKLMNVFDRFLGSKIKSNSDSRIMRMVVNLVRNFISDVFLRVITAVMTH
jgi:Putative Flp pilus-assembly TadE/G-like